jgi:hypothetical protein
MIDIGFLIGNWVFNARPNSSEDLIWGTFLWTHGTWPVRFQFLFNVNLLVSSRRCLVAWFIFMSVCVIYDKSPGRFIVWNTFIRETLKRFRERWLTLIACLHWKLQKLKTQNAQFLLKMISAAFSKMLTQIQFLCFNECLDWGTLFRNKLCNS